MQRGSLVEEELYNLWRRQCVSARTPRESWALLHATCEVPPNYSQFRQFVERLKNEGEINEVVYQEMLDGMGIFTLE
jgi:phage terminase small subunit